MTTNEEIMAKLEKIEQMLIKLTGEEEKELSELDESVNLEFPNVEDWRKEIWETCPHKEERSQGDEIDFWCKKQGEPCRFKGCPENLKT